VRGIEGNPGLEYGEKECRKPTSPLAIAPARSLIKSALWEKKEQKGRKRKRHPRGSRLPYERGAKTLKIDYLKRGQGKWRRGTILLR